MQSIVRLSELKTGETGVIVKILGHGAFRKRVIEMGFIRGRKVSVVLQAPLKDPIKYEIMGYEVGLRRSEAKLIEVVRVDADNVQDMEHSHEIRSGIDYVDTIRDTVGAQRHTINVALIGNPNCGKTSLFNHVTGRQEHVGNYSGVTVDTKLGTYAYNGYIFNIVDLPGTYSLASYSPEELMVRRYLRDETPDVIINVVDASNLERNLYLTTELIDTSRSMVIALNMFDELRNQGTVLDYQLLAKM
ncbi:MAG: FeoB small GTPase domain-containing protein, partial [Bacteroidales bacterium]|nr:FeoB small GTPase domain-containing protein [Bacteroidales bacterium]